MVIHGDMTSILGIISIVRIQASVAISHVSATSGMAMDTWRNAAMGCMARVAVYRAVVRIMAAIIGRSIHTKHLRNVLGTYTVDKCSSYPHLVHTGIFESSQQFVSRCWGRCSCWGCLRWCERREHT